MGPSELGKPLTMSDISTPFGKGTSMAQRNKQESHEREGRSIPKASNTSYARRTPYRNKTTNHCKRMTNIQDQTSKYHEHLPAMLPFLVKPS